MEILLAELIGKNLNGSIFENTSNKTNGGIKNGSTFLPCG